MISFGREADVFGRMGASSFSRAWLIKARKNEAGDGQISPRCETATEPMMYRRNTMALQEAYEEAERELDANRLTVDEIVSVSDLTAHGSYVAEAVLSMSRFRTAPRVGHIDRIKRVCGYMKKYPH